MTESTRTKGWEKRGPFARRPKAGPTPASQMPHYTDPVEVRLGPMHMVYQGGRWRASSDAAAAGGEAAAAAVAEAADQAQYDAREIAELRREVAELREKNRRYEQEVFYLDFKVELLSDMVRSSPLFS